MGKHFLKLSYPLPLGIFVFFASCVEYADLVAQLLVRVAQALDLIGGLIAFLFVSANEFLPRMRVIAVLVALSQSLGNTPLTYSLSPVIREPILRN